MRISIAVFLLIFTCPVFSQQIRVVSEKTGKPIENVAVYNLSRERASITDSTGFTGMVSFVKTDTLVFQHPSYNTRICPYIAVADSLYVTMTRRNIMIDEYVISASKSRESRNALPYSVSVMEKEDLTNNMAQNAADILLETGNIIIQKTQAGGGSPVLRGFEANKILLVVDGVRMNNAIYRSGHLQNAITVDNATLERTEVMFGPSSLIYGSDALGGVIHYYTRNPELSGEENKTVAGEAYAGFSSANSGKEGSLLLNVGGDQIASLTGISYKDFGLIRMGKNRNLFYGDWGKTPNYISYIDGKDSMLVNADENLQQYTAYSQLDVLQKILYTPSDYVDWILNIQYSTSSEIDRLDFLNDYTADGYLKYAEYGYGPQNRLMIALKNVNRKDNRYFTNATSIIAYQRIDEDRYSRKFQNPERLWQKEDVHVASLNLDLLKILENGLRINYGYDLIYNYLGSLAYYEDISSLARTAAETRYPAGGSQTLSTSLYASVKKMFGESLIMNGGIRYNYSYLSSIFNNPLLPFENTQISNGAFTGSLSLVYHPTPEWQINTILSTGYRNPNVDDYGKIRAKDEYIIIPNPDIKPEYTYNGELGISREIEGFLKLDAVVYYSLLTNAIVRTDFQLNGSDSMLYDGDLYRITANYNALLAGIWGTSLNLVSEFTEHIRMKGSLNYTKGRNITDDVPLGHIPPVFGRVSIAYHNNKLSFESYVHYNGWKFTSDFSPYGEDNEGEATVFGFPSWWTLNINTRYNISDHLSLQFSIENILDQFYKTYASGVSAPGRNYLVKLRTTF